MGLNLTRNTRLFISTSRALSSLTNENTWEVLVQDGYDFSQDTTADTITLDEAGDNPVRGQAQYNTQLNPVEVSFTSYIRPFMDSNNNHSSMDRILWEALVGAGTGNADSPWLNTKTTSSKMTANFDNSDVHVLLPLYLYFHLENLTYRVNEVQINSAEIDFSIDGIAQITWTGNGTTITGLSEMQHNTIGDWAAGTDYTAVPSTAEYIRNKLSSITLTDTETSTDGTFAEAAVWTVDYTGNGLAGLTAHNLSGSTAYTANITVDGGSVQVITVDTNDFSGTTVGEVLDLINTQLEGANVTLSPAGDILVTSQTVGTDSTILITDGVTNSLFEDLSDEFQGIGSETTDGTGSGTEYNIGITGGSLTIDNGVTFLTPEELGRVNSPIGSFTGTRAVSGTITAYLRSGTNETGELLNKIASDREQISQIFDINLSIGGANNTPKAVFRLPHANLVVPTFSVEDVISTEINFTGLGQALDVKDELLVEYVAT